MSKTKLGIKRRCGSCGTKFYDFNKSPIICPSCEAKFDHEQLLKSRRGRVAAKTEAAESEAVAENVELIADDDQTSEVQNEADELADGDEFVAPPSSDDDESADVVEDEEFIATLDDEDIDEEDV